MKTLKQFLEALIELVFLVITSTFAFIRWIWRKFKLWWKRRNKWAKAVIIFLLAIWIFSDDIGYYHRRISNPYKEKLTECTSVHDLYGGKSRLYDDVNDKYLTPKYKWISPLLDGENYDDTLTVFCDKNDKRGYLNAYTGEVVIEPQYDAAWVFSEGLAAVMKDDTIAFIDRKGEIVIPFNFRHNERRYDYDYIDYVFHDGYCYMIGDNGYLGLINKSGEWCIEPAYIFISRNCMLDGYKIVAITEKEGYVDKNMNVVFPAEYSDITITSDGFILAQDNRIWKEDFEGNVIIPTMFEYIHHLEYVTGYDEDGDEIYEISDTYQCYYVDGRCGIYNIKDNEFITPAIYTDIDMLDKNLFSVELEYSGCYVIDGTGKRVN